MPVAAEQDTEDTAIILGWIAGAQLPGDDDDDDVADDDDDDDDDDVAETGDDDDDDDDDDGTVLCGIDDVTMGVASPVEAGDEAGLIPTEIGRVIDENCGCHLVSDNADLIENVPGYAGMFSFNTLDEIQADFNGAPAYEHLQARVVDSPTMPPVYYCTERDVAGLLQADFDLLEDWLSQGAPDGATWTPPG